MPGKYFSPFSFPHIVVFQNLSSTSQRHDFHDSYNPSVFPKVPQSHLFIHFYLPFTFSFFFFILLFFVFLLLLLLFLFLIFFFFFCFHSYLVDFSARAESGLRELPLLVRHYLLVPKSGHIGPQQSSSSKCLSCREEIQGPEN